MKFQAKQNGECPPLEIVASIGPFHLKQQSRQHHSTRRQPRQYRPSYLITDLPTSTLTDPHIAKTMTLTYSSRLAVGLSRSIKRGFSQVGDPGSGSGKGGGAGGSIRDAGGAFGKQQAAREEQYFRKLEKEQLKALQMQYKNLRKEMEREIEKHESHAREHKEAAERLRRRASELEKQEQQMKNE
ncbi:unnamed protein product [Cercopithifilaria johnstoni]|uniref:ATPase inhibitor, mitochondrial n=1 Tax=Cercopithifilaria johnstoni TaxID=2874296 RepID=A0A8J2PUM6_9BILA|nr:unnamed protein product [Cercopithifilaria johnstoni]